MQGRGGRDCESRGSPSLVRKREVVLPLGQGKKTQKKGPGEKKTDVKTPNGRN